MKSGLSFCLSLLNEPDFDQKFGFTESDSDLKSARLSNQLKIDDLVLIASIYCTVNAVLIKSKWRTNQSLINLKIIRLVKNFAYNKSKNSD